MIELANFQVKLQHTDISNGLCHTLTLVELFHYYSKNQSGNDLT